MRSLIPVYRYRFALLRAAAFAVFAASLAGSLFAQSVATTLNLFNGSSLLGWHANGAWSPTSGTLQTSGSEERSIYTAVPFSEFSLSFEYNVSDAPDAALLVWANHDGASGYRIDLDNANAPAGVGGVENGSHSSISSVSEGWHRALVEVSGGEMKVSIDGNVVATLSGMGDGGGYLGFDAKKSGSLALRSIRLTPRGLHASFNGTDLAGWKGVDSKPAPSSGVGHAVEKTFTFGLGGSSKPHGAKWNVHAGAIHGEHGPGALEGAKQYTDLIVHVNAQVQSDAVKKENFTALLLRNPSGQLNGGYAVGLGPYAGQIKDLSKGTSPAHGAGFVDQTIVLAGRTIAIWSGPNLLNVYTDTRPEAQSTVQGARVAAGPLSLVLPNGSESVDVSQLSSASLPTTYGVVAKKSTPPPEPTPVVAAAAPTPVASPAETAILQAQQVSAKKDAQAQAARQHTASLMSQALATSDPQQQMDLYGQVVQIDPTNSAAVQGFKDAQAKVQQQQAGAQKQQDDEVNASREQQDREQKTTDSLNRAESSFLGGHLSQASSALSVAERLSPANPLARDLRNRINAASALRSRLYMLGTGVGIVGFIALIMLWLRRRKQQRHPVLEVTRGLDSGQRYAIAKDKVCIGAISQDAGKKNDVVVRDVEHMISRFHCEIERRGGQLYVSDLHSSNGTYLNGMLLKPNAPALLRRGARIDLGGSVELQLTYDRETQKK